MKPQTIIDTLFHLRDWLKQNGFPGYRSPYMALGEAIKLIKEQQKIIDQYHKADMFLNAHGWNWEEIDDGR